MFNAKKHPSAARFFHEKSLNDLFSVLQPDQQVLVGFSGGCDSTLLLDLAVECLGAGQVRAIHVHHGLSPKADQWQGFCESFCRARNVELQVVRANPGLQEASGEEERCRKARFALFAESIRPGELLLLGHHQDDQVETFFQRLLRGSGLAGLSALQTTGTTLHGLTVYRPFLQLRRKQLVEIALSRSLDWVDDESNLSTRYDRNYLRHRVLPVLEERWPGLFRVISREVDLIQRQRQLLAELGEQDLQQWLDENSNSISVSFFRNHSRERANNMLHHWILSFPMRPPSSKVLGRVYDEVLTAEQDRTPQVIWQDGEFRRFRDRVYLLPCLPQVEADKLPLLASAETRFNGLVFFSTDQTEDMLPGEGWSLSFLELMVQPDQVSQLRLASLPPGATIRQRGMSRSIRECWRAAGVPPWVRDRLPGVFLGQELIAVPYVGVDDDNAIDAQGREKKQRIYWRKAFGAL